MAQSLLKKKAQIRKFDPSTMNYRCNVVMLGKKGTGKSTLLLDIISRLAHNYDMAIAFSPTYETRKDLKSHIPGPFIYSEYRQGTIDQWVNIARDLVDAETYRSFLCILDDCMYDTKCLKSKSIREIFMNGRHLHFAFFMAVQYLMDIPTALRGQVDYVFALKENIVAKRQRLWKEFFGVFENLSDFSLVLESCTNNFECLVLDNRVSSSNIEDCVFWYKADTSIPAFRIGKDCFWRMAKRYARGKRGRSQPQQGFQKTGKTIASVEKSHHHTD